MTNEVRFLENKVCGWRKAVEGCAAAIAVLGGFAAQAAVWNVTTAGGNLDKAENWNPPSGSTWAIRVQQSGPFTISEDRVGLPIADTVGLQYDYSPRFYTNHFTAGWTFSHKGTLFVQGGATLVQESGTMNPSGDTSVLAPSIGSNVTTTNTRYVISGKDAAHSGTKLKIGAQTTAPAATGPVQPDLIVEKGATVNLSSDLLVNGGWSVSRSLVTGSGSSLSAYILTMGGTDAERQPGLVRELSFDDHATGSFSSTSMIGSLSGGNRLAVRNGASVSFDGAVYVSSTADASSNNVVEVDGGTLTLASALSVGSSAGSWGNGLLILNGGTVRLTGNGDNQTLKVGQPGCGNFVTVAGAGSSLDCGSTKVFVGGQAGSRDGTYDGNMMTVADGAEFSTANDVHVGRYGNDCRLSVTNGASFVAGMLCVYTSGVFYAEKSAVALTNGITFADGGGEATFKDSGVRFAIVGKSVGGTGGVLSFVGSEVEAKQRFDPTGDLFTMRLDDSRFTYDPNAWFITGSKSDASETRHYVFEGANPHLKITGGTGMFLRGKVTLEFNIPDVGFPTDHPVIDLQHASAKFNGDTATKTDRTLVVNVSDKCPPGTYTLMRGADANTLFKDGTITCTSPKTKIKITTVDGVAAIQAKVSGGMMILFR